MTHHLSFRLDPKTWAAFRWLCRYEMRKPTEMIHLIIWKMATQAGYEGQGVSDE